MNLIVFEIISAQDGTIQNVDKEFMYQSQEFDSMEDKCPIC